MRQKSLSILSSSTVAAVLLSAWVVLLNLNAFSAFFVGDDYDFFLRVGEMLSPLEALTETFWGEWEPLWYLSWYIDAWLWGFNPVGFHLTNVAALALTVVALFALVRILIPDVAEAAWAAGLLFAAYPLHDEAVTYLAARGHVFATGLGLAALWAYANHHRRHTAGQGGWGLWVAALLLAFLAACSKETALTLPIWAAAVAACLPNGRPGRAALAFTLPASAYVIARWLLVGFRSEKIQDGLASPAGVLRDLVSDLPAYVVLGLLPLPFGVLDKPALERVQWLGWPVLALLVGGWVVVAVRRYRKEGGLSPTLKLFGTGLLITAVSLGPVIWAGLSLRRRYLYTPSVGIVLIATALFCIAWRRRPQISRAILLLIVVAFSITTVHRNELYRRSGELAREIVETLRGAPLDQNRGLDYRPGILLTLPRAYGGDSLSGAYLFHHTDLYSAMYVFDAPLAEVEYALKCYFADDYASQASLNPDGSLELQVDFASQRAFASSAWRDAEDDYRGDTLRATLSARDDDQRRLSYTIEIDHTRIQELNPVLYALDNRRLVPVDLN